MVLKRLFVSFVAIQPSAAQRFAWKSVFGQDVTVPRGLTMTSPCLGMLMTSQTFRHRVGMNNIDGTTDE